MSRHLWQQIMDEKMRGLPCQQIQVDEIWGFIGAKRKNAARTGHYGNVGRGHESDSLFHRRQARPVSRPRLHGRFGGPSFSPRPLEHAELAHLQRHHFYKDLDQFTYQQFVLSPVIDRLPLSELNWRRTLWENFYPRVRHENDPALAAQTVVRYLRERVGIDSTFAYRVGVETIWTQQVTDEIGFERIYVAALRSVGIAARLGAVNRAELWADNAWQMAPRPIIENWSGSKKVGD